MISSAAEQAAMARALELAANPGVPFGPNPRVGCVLLDADGATVAEGLHRGAGNPHAEVDALTGAGDRARGATAVVTLEPCNHTGRTGPCAAALIEAGVRRVLFAQPDPNPLAQGGAQTLAAAGVEVHQGLLADQASRVNRGWAFGLSHGRPFVTWKFATTLDGRSAAADGTSRWVSGPAARRDTHRLRALSDTMLVGTETVLVDDPLLTARDDDDQPLGHQPLRAVLGERDLPAASRVLRADGESVQLRTRDLSEALVTLFAAGRREVFLEGGPTLAAAFLRAGLVDEIVCYVAPMLLGAGRSAVADLGIPTIAQALRPRVIDVTVLQGADDEEADVRFTLTPRTPQEGVEAVSPDSWRRRTPPRSSAGRMADASQTSSLRARRRLANARLDDAAIHHESGDTP